jgi:hypothetical protein
MIARAATSRLLCWHFARANIGREVFMKKVFDRRSFVGAVTAAAAAAIAPSPIYARLLTGAQGAKESLLPGIPGLCFDLGLDFEVSLELD